MLARPDTISLLVRCVVGLALGCPSWTFGNSSRSKNMRDHEELDVFLGRSLPLANAPAAAASTANVSNGRPPPASVARQTAAPASTGNRFPPPSSAPGPPRRTLSNLSTATAHSSSVTSMMDESVESQISLGFTGGGYGNGNINGSNSSGNGSNSHKRPLASLNPNSSSSGIGDTIGAAGGGGGGDCSMIMVEDDAANYYHTGNNGSNISSHRGAAASTSPAWSSTSAMSSAPPMQIYGQPAIVAQPSHTDNLRHKTPAGVQAGGGGAKDAPFRCRTAVHDGGGMPERGGAQGVRCHRYYVCQ